MTTRLTHNVRFEPELWERLTKAAEERTVSVTWLITRLCSEGLDNLFSIEEMRVTRRPR